MATFPSLKTGAVAQYPSGLNVSFSTQVIRFLDGKEQRFPSYGTPLRKWSIALSLLDESELETLADFFEEMEGRAGTFTFTDPWSGTVYSSCSFDSDSLALGYQEVARGKTSLVIRENRS